MIVKKNINKWLLIILVTIGLIPIGITAFELIFAGKKSVVFLENYNPNIAFLVISYYILLLSFAVFWFMKQLVSISKLKNEKTKIELMHLKSQVNPHFFFNTLNNLYGLVEKDPKIAQKLILKLSDMMRYSIYEGENDLVELKEEVTYLENYIALHKMRYHKKIAIDFDCEIDGSYRVTPLLFIILLENAFKHGVENLRENAYVNLNLKASTNEIQFTIENNFEKAEYIEKPGIGLKNLKRRLELVYPNKYKLLFSTTENIYRVQLTLNQL